MKYSKVAQFCKVAHVAKAAIFSMAVFSQFSYGALYEVSEVQTQDIAINAFAIDLNSAGDVVLTLTVDSDFPLAEFNIPINLELIDFDSEAIANALTDVDSARNGDFNLQDYLTILGSLRAVQGLNTSQPLVAWQSYVSDNGVVDFIPGLDMEDADYGGYTKTVDTRVRAINDNDVIAGNSQGVPRQIEYTNENGDDTTYIIRDHDNRGFVDLNGTVVGLVSESDLAGGFTRAYDINNSLVVAGTEIFDPSEQIQTVVENCMDEETRGDQPEELCLNNLYRVSNRDRSQSILVADHQRRAVLWRLDNEGNVVDKTTFDLPFERGEDDNRIFVSEAFAVNENGVAVGRTTDFHEGNENFPRPYAAVFNNGETTSFSDVNEYENSEATDINDNNMVTGFATININGFNRTKFFVYNIDTNEVNFPDDFFSGSSSIARSINNNGQVVGEGEVEGSITGTRRRNAFLYDINDDTFLNLNDLVGCDSPYTLVQASSINDTGQIAATAIVRRPQRDVQGNLALNADGSETLVDTLVSVLLNPIPGGVADDCAPPPEEVEERSGSTGLWSVLLLPVLLLRRFRKA